MVHLVDQVLLYRTSTTTIPGNSDFLIDFFQILFSLTCYVGEHVYQEKSQKIFSIHKDSDAVFHEESESVIGFKIRATNDTVSLVYRCYFNPFFAKMAKM